MSELRPTTALRYSRCRGCLEEGGTNLNYLDQKILLRVDVAVERGTEHSDLTGKIAHRCAVITLRGKQPAGRFDHVLHRVRERDAVIRRSRLRPNRSVDEPDK